MKTFVTSDLHFSHKNILKFCPATRERFSDVREMNEWMIQEWNATVAYDDVVYILGDVSFAKLAETVAILKRLNGTKHLIIGNHDEHLIDHQEFIDCFASVKQYDVIEYNKIDVVLFHFPIFEWFRCHRGSVHLHGHTHQNATGLEQYRIRNVGWDYTGKLLSSMDDVVADALTGEVKTHGQSNENM